MHYEFFFADGSYRDFSVDLQRKFKESAPIQGLPEWTRLEHKQCRECPFENGEMNHCPIAADLFTIADMFAQMPSTARVEAIVHKRERSYRTETDLQTALGSLFFTLMMSSECPHTLIFRNGVIYFPPFPSLKDSIFRILCFYLLHEFALKRKSEAPVITLDHLYDKLSVLTSIAEQFARRIHGIYKNDSNINALVLVSSLSSLVELSFPEELESILDDFLMG